MQRHWLLLTAVCAACSAVGAVSRPDIDDRVVVEDALRGPADFLFLAEQLDHMLESNSSAGSKSNCEVCDALLAELQQLTPLRASLERLLDVITTLAPLYYGICGGPETFACVM